MNCIQIEISDSKATDVYSQSEHLVINSADLAHFIQTREMLWEAVRMNATAICGNCGSFQVPAAAIYGLFHAELFGPVDAGHEEDGLVYEICRGIFDSLTEEIIATEAEWEGFEQYGIPDLKPLYDQNREYVYREEGECPLRHKCEHIAFKRGIHCDTCNHLI